MNFNKKNATVLILIITVALFIFLNKINHKSNKLYLINDKTNEIINVYDDVDFFSVKFIHSVHKTPLEDFYKIENKKIYVYKTVYSDYGAGVQTELNDGESFYYSDNNELVVDNINKYIPKLIYVVGTWSDHILTINNNLDNQVSLRNLCGQNTHVRFTVK